MNKTILYYVCMHVYVYKNIFENKLFESKIKLFPLLLLGPLSTTVKSNWSAPFGPQIGPTCPIS